MKALLHLIETGGPAMIAIIALSVVLYSRCFLLFFDLARRRRDLPLVAADRALGLSWEAHDLEQGFRHERISLGAMIAAAPLLGLLGTVIGMTRTFESVAAQVGQKSMEGLASGISEVLISTESGLAVAIPALLLVYVAHRQMHRLLQDINRLEHGGSTEANP